MYILFLYEKFNLRTLCVSLSICWSINVNITELSRRVIPKSNGCLDKYSSQITVTSKIIKSFVIVLTYVSIPFCTAVVDVFVLYRWTWYLLCQQRKNASADHCEENINHDDSWCHFTCTAKQLQEDGESTLS